MLTYKQAPDNIILAIFQDKTIAQIKPFEVADEFEFKVFDTEGNQLNQSPLLSINHAKAVVEYYLELKK